MKVIQNLHNPDEILIKQQSAFTIDIIAIIVIILLFIGAIVSCILINKSMNKENSYTKENWLTSMNLVSFALFCAIFIAGTKTWDDSRYSYVENIAFDKATDNPMLTNAGEINEFSLFSEPGSGDTFTINSNAGFLPHLSPSDEPIYTIKTNWDPDDEYNTHDQDLIDVKYDAVKPRIIYEAKSKLGHAYLRVGEYIMQNSSNPVHLKWQAKPYQISAKYEDTSGSRNIICRVDNKKVATSANETVIKY